MRKTELEYYQKYAPRLVEEPPASTILEAASLVRPEFLVEVEVIAVVSRK
jgi:enamine deaminase RidA (YjgF/YER057c/UK114 family)